MQLSHLTKSLLVGTIAASTVILPLSVSALAQTSGSTTTPDTTDTTTYSDDNDFDWGWLGLLGLIGLAGLKRRPEDRTEYRDPNVDPRTVTRSDYR